MNPVEAHHGVAHLDKLEFDRGSVDRKDRTVAESVMIKGERHQIDFMQQLPSKYNVNDPNVSSPRDAAPRVGVVPLEKIL